MKISLLRYLSLSVAFSCIFFSSCEKDEVSGKISVEITSPSDGSMVQGTVDIQYTITQQESIDRIELVVDDILKVTYLEVPENIVFNTAEYINGNHTIVLRVINYVQNRFDNSFLEKVYWSNTITLDVQNPVIIIPSLPVLQGTSDFENSVTLSWNENLQPVSGYRVKRKLNDADFVTLAELSPDVRVFVDPNVEFDTTNQYSYKVEVYTASASRYSNEVDLTFRAVAFAEYRSFDVPETAEGKISITPAADKVIVTNYFNNTFTVITTSNGSSTALEHVDGTMGLGMSADGTLFATQGSHDQLVDVWDTQSLTRVRQINTATNGFEVALNKTATKLALGNPIKIFEPASGNLIKDFGAGHSITRSINFSEDESLVLTAGNDDLVKLWNSETGELLKTFTGHTGHVGSSRFINNEAGVVSGSYEDNTVQIWDVESGGLINTNHFISGIVGILNLKGQQLAIATADGTIFVSNEQAQSQASFGRSLRLYSIAYASGKQIIAAYYHQKVVLYKPTAKEWGID